MITPMLKVTFMGPLQFLIPTVDLVHTLGVVHLDPFPIPSKHGDYIKAAAKDQGQSVIGNGLNSLLERVFYLQACLPLPGAPSRAPSWLFDRNISGIDITDELNEAEMDIMPAYERLLTSRNELAMLSRYGKVVASLYPLLQETQEVQNLELTGIIIERKREGVLPLLEKELGRTTDNRYRIFTGEMNRENIASIIAYPADFEKDVKSLFSTENITEIRLPVDYADKPLASTLRLILRRSRELPHKIETEEKRLREMSLKWRGTIARMIEIIRDRQDELGTLKYGARSRHTFYLQGWVPENKTNLLRGVMKSNFGNDVLVEVSPAQFHEFHMVPVELENRSIVKIFEPLVQMVALPRYGSIDPTPFVAFFFPLFFGFILGDIGYGLVLLALSGFAFRKFRERVLIRNLSVVFMLSGASAIGFGIMFGEFLGNLGQRWGLHPLLMDREALVMPLLFIAVGLGFAHILVGFILRMVIAFRHKHRKDWMAAAANIAALISLATIMAATAGFMPYLRHGGIWLLALGLLLLVCTEGFFGPLEFLKTCGNVLSYARLMAIGISSLVLANVANMVGSRVEFVVTGVLIALVFHALALILGIFSPSIHSLRLHYVEFFSKFNQPGGRPYQPFRRHRTL